MNGKKRNVLSLFDGMSCGQIALNRAGIQHDDYYASEIEKASIKVTQHHFPKTLQMGDVRNLSGESFSDIFILMGGSPCQSFSFSGKRKGMTTTSNEEVTSFERYLELKNNNFEFEGQSYLFWEYVRILKEVNPKYFLLENVIMEKKWENIISNTLQVLPIEINSSLLTAQNRRRLYWTNIEGITLPEDKNVKIKDIVFDNSYKIFTKEIISKTKMRKRNYVQWSNETGLHLESQQNRAYYLDGKFCTLPKSGGSNKLNIVLDYEKDIYRRIHPIEAERIQTVDDNYTNIEGVSLSKRFEMLGNGWTVDIIKHIFSFVK